MTFSDIYKTNSLALGASLLGLAFIVCAVIASYTAFTIKASGDVVEVTGSAKVAVKADFARWTINLETKTPITNQQVGYDRLETAKNKIVNYLSEQGFTEIETPVATIMPTYIYPQYGEPIQTGYVVNRTIIVRSSDIAAISNLANTITPLSGADYQVTSNGLELTYQKLPETRVTLLTDAIADAKARAEAIAKETGRSVGVLRSATGGVVQVLPEGGVDVSDYGMYDTQNVNKEVMVTVRATFTLK